MNALRMFRDKRASAITLAPFYKSYRPATARALGSMLHPVAITDAWYAADCPPRLDTTNISRQTRIRWWLACFLRGAKR